MWFVPLACQEPFPTDRHDLEGFRIAALEVAATPDGGAVAPRAAIVVDGHPWSTQMATLSWGFVADESRAVDDPFDVVATGGAPALQVPADARTLVLVAEHAGRLQRAFLTVARPPATPAGGGFELGPVDLPTHPKGPELTLERRLALEAGEGRVVAPRGWLRVGVPAGSDGGIVRFMATAGTFLELSADTADWTAADGLHLDEDELDDPGRPTRPGAVTLLALTIAREGETWWEATEVFVGEEPGGVWLGGRFVPGDDVPAAGPGEAVATTLTGDPEAPSGVALSGGVVVRRADVVDWGTPALACDPPVDGPLDPDWFFSHRCAVPGEEPMPVVVVPDPAP